jgi:calmodulin
MSTIDKDKEKEEMQRQKRREKKEKQKHTEEENLKKIELQQSEKIRLNFVFNQLCELENEKSSDDDSSSKKYLRAINEKAKKKQMKFPKTKYKSKIETISKKNYKNKDEEESNSKKTNSSQKKKFSQKALRKIIRKLCNEFAKDELDNMIWEVDENLDGYISEDEFENMYKKCITDENEEESKKLFYLTQFLMYDKDQKHEITVEDTLEILCARHQNNVDQVLDAIFDIEKVDEKGKKRKIKRETLSFLEYAQRMHELSMKKRNEISNIKKTFCDNLKQEALKEAKERAERKNFEENQL